MVKKNRNCPCETINCPRYGNCKECRKYHRSKESLTACEKIKQKNNIGKIF